MQKATVSTKYKARSGAGGIVTSLDAVVYERVSTLGPVQAAAAAVANARRGAQPGDIPCVDLGLRIGSLLLLGSGSQALVTADNPSICVRKIIQIEYKVVPVPLRSPAEAVWQDVVLLGCVIDFSAACSLPVAVRGRLCWVLGGFCGAPPLQNIQSLSQLCDVGRRSSHALADGTCWCAAADAAWSGGGGGGGGSSAAVEWIQVLVLDDYLDQRLRDCRRYRDWLTVAHSMTHRIRASKVYGTSSFIVGHNLPPRPERGW